jgi:hypothetical protein
VLEQAFAAAARRQAGRDEDGCRKTLGVAIDIRGGTVTSRLAVDAAVTVAVIPVPAHPAQPPGTCQPEGKQFADHL